jgi:hypothetical protein
MPNVVVFPRRHARASGRGTPSGQGVAGQLSENHCRVRSRRRDCISAPDSSAASFLVSPSARQLTVDKPSPSWAAKARATVNNCSVPVMPAYSVGLPEKSIAILPSASARHDGYATGMDLAAVLAIIDRERGKRRDHAIEQLAGTPDAIRNMRRTLRGEARSEPTVRTLTALARALEIEPARLLEAAQGTPTDLPAIDQLRARREQLLRDVATLDRAIELLAQQSQPKRAG